MPLADFPWPPLPQTGQKPFWDGTTFRADGMATPVIQYDSAESHWSDELTLIHEAEAGNGDHPIDRASRFLALQTLRRHLQHQRGLVLDVGCSSGFLLRELRNSLPNCELIGADYIAGPLYRLACELPGVPLVQFDLRNCPLPTEQLDAVVCLNVLEHIDQDEKALGEIHRLLKTGGIAHIEVPASPSCFDIYDEFLMHHRRYTMNELKAKARRAGFLLLDETHLGSLVYPAFYFVKRRNRRYLALPSEEKAALIRRMMRTTRKSMAMEVATSFELSLGRLLRYPFGIRCVAILQKQ